MELLGGWEPGQRLHDLGPTVYAPSYQRSFEEAIAGSITVEALRQACHTDGRAVDIGVIGADLWSDIAEQRRKDEDHDPGPRAVHRQVAGLPTLERRERRVPTDKPQQ